MTEAPSFRHQPPAAPPAPVPGCVACADLARLRTEASRTGDFSRVTDCDVLLRRHPGHGA
ncbi:hypothetical protein [Streptomyces sp. NPDC020965]|uniref:hypothetical protein n=1 Tax=Streptomyces sp. NPDC020965 TaxID=3365105 RepID=UPI0037B93F5F